MSLLSASMVLLICCQPPGDAITQEVQRLGGTWMVTSSQIDGKDLTERMKGYRYVFDGQLMKLQDRQGKAVLRSDNKADERPFLINVQTNPKTMDITIQVKTKTFLSLGIYRLQGDELMLCFSEPGSTRPLDFRSKEGTTLVVLQRGKK